MKLRELEQEGAISKKSEAALQVMGHSSRPPLFYGRIKLHKEEKPLRPIVSAVGSCTYKVAKAVAQVIAPYNEQVVSYIRNSRDLVEIVRGLKMQEDEMMVSFDVISLFTSVLVKDALLAVKRRLDDEEKLQERWGFASGTMMKLLELCLTTTYFKLREKIFELKEGLAMGSAVSPPLANPFMDLETHALASFPGAPSVW